MRRVLHIGPCESRGGMSSVIRSMVKNPPNGWEAEQLNSHGNGIIEKIVNWKGARDRLKGKNTALGTDIVHFHVTHSLSWWRKRNLLGICKKRGIPVVVHIHSGKFEKFCSGIAGISVRRSLRRKNCRVIVLEKRWLSLLSKWIPEDSVVVPNSTTKTTDRRKHKHSKKIRLLMLSRNSKIKGHNIAIEALARLQKNGYEASLIITGLKTGLKNMDPFSGVEYLGWVTEEEKAEILAEVDFLISPSEYEGSSMSVIEAMVTGIPCIVSEASRETLGIPEMVVESDDPGQWAEKIIRFHGREEYLLSVSKTIEQSRRYSIEKRNNLLLEIYEKLAG